MSDLAKRLRHKADMIMMGEKISWQSDTDLMFESADYIEKLEYELEKSRSLVFHQTLSHSGRLTQANQKWKAELQQSNDDYMALIGQLEAERDLTDEVWMAWQYGGYAPAAVVAYRKARGIK